MFSSDYQLQATALVGDTASEKAEEVVLGSINGGGFQFDFGGFDRPQAIRVPVKRARLTGRMAAIKKLVGYTVTEVEEEEVADPAGATLPNAVNGVGNKSTAVEVVTTAANCCAKCGSH